MKMPAIGKVEVDMVPLIDIISLLLMFLIIVGDTSASSTSIQMKLPSASAAQKDTTFESRNRIVVQMKKENDQYFAVMNNRTLNAGALKDRLATMLDEWSKRNEISKRNDGTWKVPVKLRIPEGCPMKEVENLLATIAEQQLVDVQYAVAAGK